jgi:hypothetical protein
MKRLKTKKADLIGKYNTTLQLSVIISLALTIIAFKFFPHISSSTKIIETSQVLFKVEDISASIQKPIAPPPARPQVIVAAPSDKVLKIVLTKEEAAVVI